MAKNLHGRAFEGFLWKVFENWGTYGQQNLDFNGYYPCPYREFGPIATVLELYFRRRWNVIAQFKKPKGMALLSTFRNPFDPYRTYALNDMLGNFGNQQSISLVVFYSIYYLLSLGHYFTLFVKSKYLIGYNLMIVSI